MEITCAAAGGMRVREGEIPQVPIPLPAYLASCHSPKFAISVCRLRERGHMSKSVYVCVFHDLEVLRYVLRCSIERQF